MAEVETAREGSVMTITLNRPDVLNAFNKAMHDGLAAALEEARAPDVRAVVLTGAGRGFCVGQDLSEFREAAGDIGARLRDTYHPNVLAIRALEKPVIAAVNGAAAGAGLSFACACDLRIASDASTPKRLPEYVPLCTAPPGRIAPITSAVPTVALIGAPFASALASVVISGVTP